MVQRRKERDLSQGQMSGNQFVYARAPRGGGGPRDGDQ
jgi:hypothetical protein